MDSEQILGRGLGRLLTSLLETGKNPEIRVSGFKPAEIALALEQAGLGSSGPGLVTVLVSGAPDPAFDGILEDENFTALGRTATYGRNHNTHGFIYFQTTRESDSQSTQAMYSLRDSAFFEEGRWHHLIASIVPDAMIPPGGSSPGVPGELERVIDDLVEAHLRTRRLQLRPFGEFLARVSEGWEQAGGGNLTREEASQLIVEALPGLGLFRSTSLRDALARQSARQTRSQIKRIIYSSQLIRSSGAELDRRRLLRRIEESSMGLDPEAESEEGEEREASLERRRELAREFVENHDEEALEKLTFEDMSGVFGSRRRRRRKIGSEIQEHLEDRDEEEALEVFQELEFQERLDDQEREAAEELFRDPIFQLLDRDLQKQVKKLRPRRQRFENALFGLIETLDSLIEDEDQEIRITLTLGEGDEDSPGLRALFCFLYEPMLRRLAADHPEHLQFTEPIKLPVYEVFEELEDFEQREDTGQDTLSHLSIVLTTSEGDTTTFIWNPTDARMWMLWVRALRLEDFRDNPAARSIVSSLEDAEPESLQHTVEELGLLPQAWAEYRAEKLRQLAAQGLETRVVEQLVERFGEMLDALIRSRDSDMLQRLSSMLASDCVLLESALDSGQPPEEIWMLGSHPLRLRWLVSWRDRLGEYMRGQLLGELELSREHPEFLRQQMEGWSAHRYPPDAVRPAGGRASARSRARRVRVLCPGGRSRAGESGRHRPGGRQGAGGGGPSISGHAPLQARWPPCALPARRGWHRGAPVRPGVHQKGEGCSPDPSCARGARIGVRAIN